LLITRLAAPPITARNERVEDRRRTFILACPHAYQDPTSTIFKQKAQLTGQQQETRRVAMKSKRIPAVVIVVVSLAVSVLAILGGRAISAQDTAQAKYTVRVPNGLAFSEFRGYEGWQTVSISRNEKLMAVILDPVSVSLIRSSVLAETLLVEMRQTRAPADATSFDRFWSRRQRLFPRHAIGAIILPPA
jgi:hypothetical protein